MAASIETSIPARKSRRAASRQTSPRDQAALDAVNAQLQSGLPPEWRVGQPKVQREAKESISLRIDPDVLAHFRGEGPGYQSRMNAVLKAYVQACKQPR